MDQFLDEKLSRLKEIRKQTLDFDDSYKDDAHDLAEANYLPALDFFLDELDNPSEFWRWDCLSFIKHYDDQLDEKFINKFRNLVIFDPSDYVRDSAIGCLSKYLNKPDLTLLFALYKDPLLDNRRSAFWVLLRVCNVPYKILDEALERVKKRKIPLSIEGLKTILDENNIEMPGAISKFDISTLNKRDIRKKINELDFLNR